MTKYRNQGSGKKARSSAKPRYGGSGGQGENADSEFKEPKPPAAESHQSKKSKHEETSGDLTGAIVTEPFQELFSLFSILKVFLLCKNK